MADLVEAADGVEKVVSEESEGRAWAAACTPPREA
jgi:hypothetical protein